MKKKILASLVAAIVLVTPLAASGSSYALFDNSKGNACQGVELGGAGCGSGSAGVNTIITNVVNILTIIIGAAAVIMIIVGGFKYITSGGDSSKSASARTTIISAIIGLAIVALAQVIVQFVISKTK
ncbi:MAG TPA: pilin [Candidatus Saccharimonadales bacterium]|nr:pilin [Candidatus Saccharimonadales bacterium]